MDYLRHNARISWCFNYWRSFCAMPKNATIPDEKAKVRFIAQGFHEKEKPYIIHDTAILRTSSICLMLSSVAQLDFCIFSHNVTQAYLQSKQNLTRNINIWVKRADREIFGISEEQFLHLNKPLYGLCDAGDNCSLTIICI